MHLVLVDSIFVFCTVLTEDAQTDHLEARHQGVCWWAGKAVRIGSGIGEQTSTVLLALKCRLWNAGYKLVVATLTVLAHFTYLGVNEAMSAMKADEPTDSNQQQSPAGRHDDTT